MTLTDKNPKNPQPPKIFCERSEQNKNPQKLPPKIRAKNSQATKISAITK